MKKNALTIIVDAFLAVLMTIVIMLIITGIIAAAAAVWAIIAFMFHHQAIAAGVMLAIVFVGMFAFNWQSAKHSIAEALQERASKDKHDKDDDGSGTLL